MATLSETKSKLIKLSAQMATRLNMPPDNYEDWRFPKSISQKQAFKVLRAAENAQEQCRLWAIAIRECADSMDIQDS